MSEESRREGRARLGLELGWLCGTQLSRRVGAPSPADYSREDEGWSLRRRERQTSMMAWRCRM